ncbi:hypothetical protein R0G64_18940 [Pseudomonas otitidis]|uniref:Sulfotransferase family protein n=1 Tax=Metapseudomonas otitidis TaxID=319939 RepID=A0ABU3XU92_9GAMM|nr:hypothetical protein [Pseudomonas otitidis]MDV3441503.1 hypothetical protein [Pseudomonas otitidis]
MKLKPPLVLGYPRSGFTLLINVLAEIRRMAGVAEPASDGAFLQTFCQTVGEQVALRIQRVFEQRGLGAALIYNDNFRYLPGGPKWVRPEAPRTACFRKYIGVRGGGDFTLITSHPVELLSVYEINHFHVGPDLWPSHPLFSEHQRFASIRHPAGTVASACFSLNALASEYIQRFVPPEQDTDTLRQRLGLYKLSDLNFFEALVGPLQAYMKVFDEYASEYRLMRWEDLIQAPVSTILCLAEAHGVLLDTQQAAQIWQRLDHVNLTGAHLHNLRVGHGIVGGWRHWLTNTHLDILRDHGLEQVARRYGYGAFEALDERAYTPFQRTLAGLLQRGEVFRDYGDEDLFGFAFNKSNLDLDRFTFKRFAWKTHTQIERSTCTDDALVDAVSACAEETCGVINEALACWLDNALSDSPDARVARVIDKLTPLGLDDGTLVRYHTRLLTAVGDAPEVAHPMLLESIGTTNIVAYAGRYYALPQSLGPVDFNQDVGHLPGVVIDDQLERLVARIRHS